MHGDDREEQDLQDRAARGEGVPEQRGEAQGPWSHEAHAQGGRGRERQGETVGRREERPFPVRARQPGESDRRRVHRHAEAPPHQADRHVVGADGLVTLERARSALSIQK